MANLTLSAILFGAAHVFSGAHPTQQALENKTTTFNAPVTLSATTSLDTLALTLSTKAQNLDPKVLKLGLVAYNKARANGLDTQGLLTIVDYSKPSTETRLWVFDVKSQRLLFQDLVAHGKGSGDNVPTSFSDGFNSHKSSLGLFLTEKPYIGQHGYSLRLSGLERGYNDMAKARDIVVHAANYVSAQFAATHGRLGRSWGCFAINPKVAASLINTIKDGTLLFAYYPDHNWLRHSNYLA